MVERFRECFFGEKLPRVPVALFGSLPLSAAPKDGGGGGNDTNQHVLCDRGPAGGQQVGGGSSDGLW